jgi:chemotaxis family two-component system sensor histidine kinase/response regulator PixL
MRFAHSIKGGAASVELEAIATLAHRLENIFKVLYSDELNIDTDLESQLLQGYDCLRLPLMEQIQTGYFDPSQAFDLAEPIFAQLEERFSEQLSQADTYMPSSADLGVDMTQSIFEVDVAQGIEHLTIVVANPQNYEVAGELRAQAEVFAGFAEFLNLPDFGAIAQTTLAALNAHPDSALEITQLALVDFQLAREAVLAGRNSSTSSSVEIKPSPALVALANSTATSIAESIVELEPSFEPRDDNLFSLFELSLEQSEEAIPSIIESSFEPVEDDVFSLFELSLEPSEDTIPSLFESNIEPSEDTIPSLFELSLEPSEDTISSLLESNLEASEDTIPSLFESNLEASEDSISSLFESNIEPSEDTISSLFELTHEEIEEPIPSLEDIFGGAIATPETQKSERLITPEIVAQTQATDEAENLAISGAFVDNTTIAFDHSLEEPIALEADTDRPDSEILEVEWVEATGITEETEAEIPSLEQIFGDAFIPVEIDAPTASAIVPVTSTSDALQEQTSEEIELTSTAETLEVAIHQIEQIFESLPALELVESGTEAIAPSAAPQASANSLTPTSKVNLPDATTVNSPAGAKNEVAPTPNLSVRVDVERLGRMNNLVGELAINRNGLSLQNEQLQGSVRELLNRFSRVQNLVGQLQNLSDQMLIAPERHHLGSLPSTVNPLGTLKVARSDFDDFDSLELDNYGVVHSELQGLLEEMMQLEESVDDIVLFARATDQTLERQRQMLTQLRDELMWARMLPLGEVLNRFPRMLRDLSTTYHKPISLKLSGTGVLVDKAVLEKLFDPLLHLIRNAFDHGIESKDIRRSLRKPQQGQIEIKAYHRGSQTIIEVKDDGQGLNLERISRRAVELGLVSTEQLGMIPASRLFNLIFEPGFSTASQVSELSGRGVGLDVVRSQLRSLKGTIGVSSEAGVGTTFSLRLPLTLTIAKLLVCFSGSTALALPSDSIEEIVIPKPEQIKYSGSQQFLHWRGEIVPTYRLTDLLEYACPLPDTAPSRALLAVPTPESWASPMLVLRQEQTFLALEVDRLVTEQELVIKPFGSAIAPPSSTYGCTILGDGSVIPVIDATVLLDQLLAQSAAATATGLNQQAMLMESAAQGSASLSNSLPPNTTVKTPTVLVVDDAVALRRTLALSLERAGIRVLQARDGREAIERLQQSSSVQLVICDIEMPNMNGFEFLSHRRQDPQISKIPIVMLTSRSNDKHRWLAMQLGANAYFTKPYLEQEFLVAIKQLMGQRTIEPIPV